MTTSMALTVVRPTNEEQQEQAQRLPPSGTAWNPSVYGSLDSLPYIDKELELPGMRAVVDTLVEQEMAKISKQDAAARRALDDLPANFDGLFASDPLWGSELARARSRVPLQPLDTVRYSLDDVEEGDSEKGAQQDEHRWRRAVHRAKTRLEHLATQGINTELSAKFGPNAWLVHNFQLEHAIAVVQAETEEINRRSVEVNKERKREQLQLGSALYAANEEWNHFIGSILQTDLACAAMEADIARLNAQREMLLKK